MNTASTGKAALADVLVLSAGHTLPSLYCLAMLRDLGAQVIRIERLVSQNPDAEKYKGMDVTFPIASLTDGTHELQLDLKHPEGIAFFQRLAENADVVLEGFRPGVMQRLGIGYASLRQKNPRLVYAAITGYGQQGQYADRPGHDINYLAETGVLALANPLGLPGATYADGMAGVCAALNVVAAVHACSRSGQGQLIDCAIVDGPLMLMSSEFEHYWNTGEARGIGTTHLTGSHPWYGVYPTRDGQHIAVGAVEPLFYQTLCHNLGLPELAAQQHSSTSAAQDARARIASAIASRTLDDVLALFKDHPACVSPVRSTDQVLNSPVGTRATRGSGSNRRVRSPVRLAQEDSLAAPLTPLLALLQSKTGLTKNEIEMRIADGIMAATI